jgi:hypothetical protein
MSLDLSQSFRMRVGCTYDRWTKRSGGPRIDASTGTTAGITFCEVVEAVQKMIPELGGTIADEYK